MTPLRALLSWLVLLVLAFLNGTARQLAYPSTLGDFAARQVAAGVGAVVLGIAIWFLLRRWPAASARQAWATGALWAALTVLFEIALVRSTGRPWDDVLEQYALWKGSLWPLLVLWVLAAPAALSAAQRSGIASGRALGWAAAAWAACGLTFAVGRAAGGVKAAIAIHLLAAPFVGAAATRLLWRHPRHPGVAATALTMAGTAALLDAIVVAPFLERSYAMFASLAGTWMPLALILAGSAATAARLARREAATPHPGDRPPA
ncbi:MAG TPA: hypothetical protein VIW03_13610 [Anaeromyxobacter sp.]